MCSELHTCQCPHCKRYTSNNVFMCFFLMSSPPQVQRVLYWKCAMPTPLIWRLETEVQNCSLVSQTGHPWLKLQWKNTHCDLPKWAKTKHGSHPAGRAQLIEGRCRVKLRVAVETNSVRGPIGSQLVGRPWLQWDCQRNSAGQQFTAWHHFLPLTPTLPFFRCRRTSFLLCNNMPEQLVSQPKMKTETAIRLDLSKPERILDLWVTRILVKLTWSGFWLALWAMTSQHTSFDREEQNGSNEKGPCCAHPQQRLKNQSTNLAG